MNSIISKIRNNLKIAYFYTQKYPLFFKLTFNQIKSKVDKKIKYQNASPYRWVRALLQVIPSRAHACMRNVIYEQ